MPADKGLSQPEWLPGMWKSNLHEIAIASDRRYIVLLGM